MRAEHLQVTGTLVILFQVGLNLLRFEEYNELKGFLVLDNTILSGYVVKFLFHMILDLLDFIELHILIFVVDRHRHLYFSKGQGGHNQTGLCYITLRELSFDTYGLNLLELDVLGRLVF